jgi:hypothetical protein
MFGYGMKHSVLSWRPVQFCKTSEFPSGLELCDYSAGTGPWSTAYGCILARTVQTFRAGNYAVTMLNIGLVYVENIHLSKNKNDKLSTARCMTPRSQGCNVIPWRHTLWRQWWLHAYCAMRCALSQVASSFHGGASGAGPSLILVNRRAFQTEIIYHLSTWPSQCLTGMSISEKQDIQNGSSVIGKHFVQHTICLPAHKYWIPKTVCHRHN